MLESILQFGDIITNIANNPIPYGTLLVLFIAILTNCAIAALNRKLLNIEDLREQDREIREWTRQYTEAVKKNERHQIAKLRRRKAEIDRLRMERSSKQMRVSLYTLVPMLIVFYLLNRFFTGPSGPLVVAKLPFYSPILSNGDGNLWFVTWYFLCSVALNSPIQRIFGTYIGGD
jgi:uncharacterized membrane protein (DUF106 family)